MNIYNYCRCQTRRFLYTPTGFFGHAFNAFITILILISVALIPLEVLPFFSEYDALLWEFEFFVVIVFTIEYILRTWSAKSHLRYIFSWFGLIDLIAIVPFYLQLFDAAGFLMFPAEYLFALRLLRVFRLLKLATLYDWEKTAMKSLCKKHEGDFHQIPNEKILYIVHKHPIILFFHIFPPIVMLSVGMAVVLVFSYSWWGWTVAAVCFTFAFLIFFKTWLDYHYDVIYITSCRIIIQDRHLFGSTINDIIYEAVADIRPNTAGPWRQLFKYGDLLIETSADASRTFTYAYHPRRAVKIIARKRQEAINGIDESGAKDNPALGIYTKQRVGKIQTKAKIKPKPSEFEFLRHRIAKTFEVKKIK